MASPGHNDLTVAFTYLRPVLPAMNVNPCFVEKWNIMAPGELGQYHGYYALAPCVISQSADMFLNI